MRKAEETRELIYFFLFFPFLRLCNACGLHWAKVLKAEGKGDQKRVALLEAKRSQFMMTQKRGVCLFSLFYFLVFLFIYFNTIIFSPLPLFFYYLFPLL